MSTRQIHVFISHSWSYSDQYDTLSEWIFEGNWSVGQASLDFRDYSVPKNDPIHNAANESQLEEAIFDKISRSHVIVIPTGMYANYSKWIKKEITGSNNFGKPILAVNPHGQEKKSGIVVDNADEFVGWNQKPLISAIWKLYNQ